MNHRASYLVGDVLRAPDAGGQVACAKSREGLHVLLYVDLHHARLFQGARKKG
jgi:hypothetical protein